MSNRLSGDKPEKKGKKAEKGGKGEDTLDFYQNYNLNLIKILFFRLLNRKRPEANKVTIQSNKEEEELR